MRLGGPMAGGKACGERDLRGLMAEGALCGV